MLPNTAPAESGAYKAAVGCGLRVMRLTGIVITALVFAVWLYASFSTNTPINAVKNRIDPVLTGHIAAGTATSLTITAKGFAPDERVELFLLPAKDSPLESYVRIGSANTRSDGTFLTQIDVNPPELRGLSAVYLAGKGAVSGYSPPVHPITVAFSAPGEQSAPAAAPKALSAAPLDSPIATPTAIPVTPVPPQPSTPEPYHPPPPPTPPPLDPNNSWKVEFFQDRDMVDPARAVTKYYQIAGPYRRPFDMFFIGIQFRGAPTNEFPIDGWSSRWTRTVLFSDTENYRFTLITDDAARVWIDDRLWIDEWHVGHKRINHVDVPLQAGSHKIVVEHYDEHGPAALGLSWCQSYIDGWETRYYNNTNWTPPVVIKTNEVQPDNMIRKDWGDGSPWPPANNWPGVNNDNFSVDFLRKLYFGAAGKYKFKITVDDSVRVFIDGKQVYKTDSVKVDDVFEVTLTRGNHLVEVQMVEGGGGAKLFFTWEPPPPPPQPTVGP